MLSPKLPLVDSSHLPKDLDARYLHYPIYLKRQNFPYLTSSFRQTFHLVSNRIKYHPVGGSSVAGNAWLDGIPQSAHIMMENNLRELVCYSNCRRAWYTFICSTQQNHPRVMESGNEHPKSCFSEDADAGKVSCLFKTKLRIAMKEPWRSWYGS